MDTIISKKEFFEYLKERKISINNKDIDYLINQGLVDVWKKKVEDSLKELGLLEEIIYKI